MKRFLQLAVALCITVCAHAQFSGSGSGTKSDPYLIFNPIQLDQVRNFLGKEDVYFKMMADIDLSQFIQENYPTQGWLPIGNSSSAFKGQFDGNGKKITNMTINRPTTDDLGLFGYISDATIQNVSIQGHIQGKNYLGGLVGHISHSPRYGYLSSSISNVKTEVTISGNDYLGGIIGYISNWYSPPSGGVSAYYSHAYIENVESKVSLEGNKRLGGIVGCVENIGFDSGRKSGCTIQQAIVDCQIKGASFCGGIVGSYSNTYARCNLYCNFVDGLILANEVAGGICGSGSGDSKHGQDHYETDCYSQLHDNYFVGTLIGRCVGGICGSISRVNIYQNYSNATITGTTPVGGVVGNLGGYCEVKSNVAINDIVSGTSNVGRIYGVVGSEHMITVGDIGAATTNKALTTTKLIVNDVEQTITDTKQHGQSVGKTMLQYKATYQSIGWDFSSTWNMQETETYPYLAFQSAPPMIDATTALSGSKQLKGKGTANAKIYVEIGGKTYSTTCPNNNTWSINVEQLVAGSEISAYAVAPSKKRSYITRLNVSYAGAGTEADPYRIYTKEELANMNAKGHYILMNDIDLSSVSNWTPIAENSTISGSFNGQNYTISGLTVNSTNSYAGLFAACTDMTIKNLNLAVKKISGSGAVGSLVAKSTNSQFENCHVTITSSIKGVNEVGGLIGLAQKGTIIKNSSVTGVVQGGSSVGGVVGSLNGKISKSTYNGTITSTTSSAKLGGIVGVNAASVSECKSSGKVACTASGSIVGGLIGENGKYSIENCYSTMTVTANKYAGGLVGYNYGKITKCYASGNLTSTTNAGGVVGYNDGTSAVVSYCCAMNNEIKVTSSTGVAIRVIGGLKNSAPLPENNYALKTMAVSVNGVAQTIYDDNLNGLARTDVQLKQLATFSTAGWNMTNIWGIEETQTYPYLKCHTKFAAITFQNYDGTALQSSDVMLGITPAYTGKTPTKAANVQYTYTFKGWNPIVVPAASDAIYTAEFDSVVNKYLITFCNADGTELKSEEVEYGVMPIAPTDPTKGFTAQYDYTFAGWTPAVAIVTQAATYTATYTSALREYLVTFLNDDNTVISSKNYKYGETPVAPADPIKQNTAEYTYMFNGWDNAIAQVQGPQTYKATFTATKNSYTITWQDENGSLINKTTVEYGVVPTHAEPTKENTAEYTYTFAGWTPAVVAVTGDATYKATFNATKNKYLIIFRDENGTELKSEEVEYGVMPIVPTDPTKESTAQYDYTFAGWTPAVAIVTQAATYTATYTSALREYLVTFLNDDNTVISSKNYKYGETPVAPADPIKQNTAEYTYMFNGWDYAIAQVLGPQTYKATYTATKNSYTITWQNEDGSLIDQTIVEYGQIPAHADPVKLNTAEYTYTFAGWTPAVVAVTGNATYKATFSATKNSYTITWQDENGSLIDQTTVEYGQIPAHADPVKLNTAEYTYTFAGWTPAVVAVTGNATYRATFTATKNSYTITWQNEDGSLIDQTTVEYGIVPTHADPIKQNTAEYTYTFSGWTPVVVAVTGNTTYRATFTATKNSYTITWQNEDGSLIDQTTVEYGQIPVHADPVKLNTAEYTYTFSGWTPTVVAVTGNATYRATFTATKNKYLITFRNDDGIVLKSEEVEYGMLPIAPATPTKESTAQYNYEFAGWTPSVTLVSQAATYTATYNASVREYLVTFLNDDNSIISMQSCKYGSYPTIPSTPTKHATAEFSYTFAGWTPNIVAVSGDVTYKATFNATKNSYTITWQNEDGSLIDQTTVEYGVVPTHAEPTKEATEEYTYTFTGWTPAVVAVTGNTTYKATFSATKNSYTITWQDENGSLIDQTTVEYGQIPAHADPVKQNTAEYTYTFAGWTPAVVAVTGDATYKATFTATKNSYTITWQNEDGSLIDQTTVEYGVVPTHAEPTKEPTEEYTYTFTGWTPAVVAVTGDATYTATFSSVVNVYTISVSAVNGQVIGGGEYQYGATIDLTAIPNEGYVFDQWSDGVKDNPRTITVTGDAEYTALFTSTEGFENIYTSEPVQKVIIDQKVYILRGEKVYTLQGQEVK